MQKSKTTINEDGVFIASHLSYSTFKGSVFAQLTPDLETKDRLDHFCMLNDIPQTKDFDGNPLKEPFHYHMTVVYSKDQDSVINTGEINLGVVNRSIELHVTGLDFLGENKDIPVFLLSEGDAYTSKLKFLSDIMLTNFRIPPSKFPFKPHVSLSYNREPFRVNSSTFEPSFAQIRKKPLVFDKFSVVRRKVS